MSASGLPYGYRKGQPVVWFHRRLRRSNRYCLYCGRLVVNGSLPSAKEHLIGRSFVPDGSLAGATAFNFIFRACDECNARKADLERHISTTTLFDSPARTKSDDIDALARRKASQDYHPKSKGVLVQDSEVEQTLRFVSPGLKIEFVLVGPPLTDHEAIRHLAFMHVQGFFALLASKDPTDDNGIRVLPPRHFWFGGAFRHSDWGNPWLRELDRRVRGWSPRLALTTANGFFRAAMRCDEKDTKEWFWALEWNKSARVVGGIADATPAAVKGLPKLALQGGGPGARLREEIPLSEGDDDTLFDW